MIAALFVARGGVYWDLEGVDPYDAERDARKYPGPHPVVAHPPCDRWCQMAPVNQARYGHRVGDDGGCFASALASVRRWGGVLEHPAFSIAWERFGLRRPHPRGGWEISEWTGGKGPRSHVARRWHRRRSFVCQVEQRNYGHRARKKTWLYAVTFDPPELIWGPGAPPEAWISADRPRAELAAAGIAQLSKREAKATPPAFRDLLISIAETAKRGEP